MFGPNFTTNFLVGRQDQTGGTPTFRKRRRRLGQLTVQRLEKPFQVYAPLSRSFETPFRVFASFKEIFENKVLFHLTFKGIVEKQTRLVAKIDPTHVIEGWLFVVLNLLNKKKDV